MEHKERKIAMAETNLLARQGLTQKEIASRYGVTDRTIRNWQNTKEKAEKQERISKLTPVIPYLDAWIKDRPEWNSVYLFRKIKELGYTGGITILRDYVAEKRRETGRQVEIRFETEPGAQAQVDWKEFGRQTVNGREQKLYAFVMILGYSRKPFIRFTTSMKESVLLDCHRLAFEHFGGVPKEILYDNMKTAWLYDPERGWVPNARLLGLANHYGFIPRRCKVKRPKTKGKVERMIRYLKNSFWPGVMRDSLTLDGLDEAAMRWVVEVVGPKILREFGESRDIRFEREKPFLGKMPAAPMECRELRECIVSRESFILLEGKRYSVPPENVGKTLAVRIDLTKREAELLDGAKRLRKFALANPGGENRVWLFDDRQKVMASWVQRNRSQAAKIRRNIALPDEVETRHPAFYDRLVKEVRA